MLGNAAPKQYRSCVHFGACLGLREYKAESSATAVASAAGVCGIRYHGKAPFQAVSVRSGGTSPWVHPCTAPRRMMCSCCMGDMPCL